jgi:hypothetical protein
MLGGPAPILGGPAMTEGFSNSVVVVQEVIVGIKKFCDMREIALASDR